MIATVAPTAVERVAVKVAHTQAVVVLVKIGGALCIVATVRPRSVRAALRGTVSHRAVRSILLLVVIDCRLSARVGRHRVRWLELPHG